MRDPKWKCRWCSEPALVIGNVRWPTCGANDCESEQEEEERGRWEAEREEAYAELDDTYGGRW